MTLQECFAQLPNEMRFVDLSLTGSVKERTFTVEQLKQMHTTDTTDQYEVRQLSRNYGRTQINCIGVIGGFGIFNEVR